DDVETVLAKFGEVSAVKVKVADPDVATDIARVQRVRELLPEAAIRIDANAGYTHDQAFETITALDFLDYAEQPVAGIQPLAELRTAVRGAVSTALAAAAGDVRYGSVPRGGARGEGADVFIVRVPALGGVRGALSIVDRAGVQPVRSCDADASVGL